MKHHENGTPYVVLKAGETLEDLADSAHESSVLLSINDASYETVFHSGEAVYIDYKKPRSKQGSYIASQGRTACN